MTDYLPWAFVVTVITLIGLGIRHALDVDHITAIDNLVRFHNADKRSRWVGTGFSAGHMLSVLGEMIIIVFVAASVLYQGGVFSLWTGAMGAVALGFIGAINMYAMKKFGKTAPAILIGKILPRTKGVGTFGSSFIIGMIFGLGFDTATQISALAISAASSVVLGIESSLVMIAIFGIGMISMDSLDSILFRSAFSRTLGTRGFRYLSYLLSAVAFVIAISSLYESLTHSNVIPELSGPVLCVSVLVCAFAYAYAKGRRKSSDTILKTQ
jgi:high-affinity nickel-transport protein